MGYTHYWYRKPKLPIKEFTAFAQDVYALLAKADISLTYWSMGAKGEIAGFVANPDEINFNGYHEDAHEIFYLTRNAKKSEWENKAVARVFTFCKTARKPYDKYVVACLLLAKYHFVQEDFIISSDGSVVDWQEGLALLNKNFPYGCSLDVDAEEGMGLDDRVAFLPKKYADEMQEPKEPKEPKVELRATPEEIHNFEVNYMQ